MLILKKAFSLAEIAIVLILIGLVIALALGAKSLLDQSKLNSLTAEINNIKSAFTTFQLTYNATPGDYKDAYNAFSSNGCGNDASYTISQADKITACNGDGDINISNNGITIGDAGGSPDNFFREEHNVWNHLSYSGMMVIPTAANNYFHSKSFDNLIITLGSHDLTNNPEIRKPKNVMFIGALRTDLIINDPSQTYVIPANILSPRLTKKLDQKLDDGIAYKGFVQGFGGYDTSGNVSSNCAAPVTNYNGENNVEYNLSNNEKNCIAMIDFYTIY